MRTTPRHCPVLLLVFQYFELYLYTNSKSYKNSNNQLVSSFIDSGVAPVLPMVCFSPSTEQRKEFKINNRKANNVDGCIMNRQIVYAFIGACQQITYIVKQLNSV